MVAISSLIFAMAAAGFRPLGHVREQLKIVWQRYMLMSFCSRSLRSWPFVSCRIVSRGGQEEKDRERTRESAIHR